MKTPAPLTAIAVVLLAGAPALAQPTFDGRVGFRSNHNNVGEPNIHAPFIPTFVVAQQLQAVFGGFEAQGFTSRGMFNFIGTVTLSDPLGEATLSLPSPSLRSPYAFGAVVSVDPTGTVISFDANRGSGQVNVPWPDGQPNPVDTHTYPANQGGPDSYFPGLRFFLNMNNFDTRPVTITVTGSMQMISEWFFLGGEIGDSADLLPAGWVQAPATSTLTVIMPAPGAAATLALAGLVAARRRR